MSTDIRLLPEAEQDLFEAATWYEQQRLDLGQRFLDEVVSALAAIAENPRRCQALHRGVRRMLLRRFPFSVFYLIEDDGITVIAVMHASRNPRRWKSRT